MTRQCLDCPRPTPLSRLATRCARCQARYRNRRWRELQRVAPPESAALIEAMFAIVRRIRRMHGRVTQREIAAIVGASLTLVNQVIHRHRWAHVK